VHPKKRPEETHEPDHRRFFPFRTEDLGIEFGPGQKGKNNGARAGEKADPACLPAQISIHEKHANQQLGDRADNNLGERGRDLEPDGDERRDQGQAYPHSGQHPHILHEGPPH